MCGIAGILYLDGRSASADEVEPMLARIVHRGPDQGAVVVDGEIALGNRRLAILDLSPAGALPMRSHDGRYTLAYNGEMYNHLDVRAQLPALRDVQWRTHSDAETLIELWRAIPNIHHMMQHVRGMFAFALWDNVEKTLFIARDRMGEKPLYYYHDAHVVVFASEIKALLAHPAVPRQSALSDPEMLAMYLANGYIPHGWTAFQNIHALPPGCSMFIVDGVWEGDGEYDRNPPAYWHGQYLSGSASQDPPPDETTWAARVRDGLSQSVKQALISDVPLGAFLSGGLDSSLIVALMKQHAATVKTFSIGFEGDDSYDETRYAEQVARHLGTDHTSFTIKADALDLLPKLVWHHDQPFADSSAIPTYWVSKLTREHVTVALTGDGGDELFAGYDRFYAAGLTARLGFVPKPIWRAAERLLSSLPEGTGYYNLLKRGRRFVRAASQPPALAYFDLVRVFSADLTSQLIEGMSESDDPAAAHFVRRAGRGDLPGLMYANRVTYLPDDLLIKTDRSSMAVSLETRAPFLDHKLVELAGNIPDNLKLKGRTTKYILKQAARGLLPDSIIDRPKHGFGVPMGAWLRRDMRIVRDTLLSHEARARGLLDMRAVESLIDEHVSGQRDHGGRLWALLTLEWWHRLFIDPPILPDVFV
jgi:asparagine synthase (glutamine-hydrolysing)